MDVHIDSNLQQQTDWMLFIVTNLRQHEQKPPLDAPNLNIVYHVKSKVMYCFKVKACLQCEQTFNVLMLRCSLFFSP